jgi:hypothetical protein
MMFSLPDRHDSVQAILAQENNLTLEQAERQIIIAEENWSIRNAKGKGSNVLFLTKCPHKRKSSECWTCTPAKHPKNATCNDCGKKGHFNKKWRLCDNHEVQRETKTPSSDDFKEKLVGLASDADLWVNEPTAGSSQPSKRKLDANETELKRPRLNDLRQLIDNKSPIDHYMCSYILMVNQNKRQKRDTSLVIDSGCARSIVINESMLQEYKSIQTSMNTANDSPLICTGIGKLPTPNFTLEDVLYSPDLTFNLLSVSQLADMDLSIQFNKYSCRIHKNGQPNHILMEARREGNLYIHRPSNRELALISTTTSKTTLAHRRMGHLNMQSLRLLQTLSTGLELDQTPKDPCTVCIVAKSHKSHYQSSQKQSSFIGELIHTDEGEMEVRSINGEYKYYVVFIDDYTRFITLYPLSLKSNAYSAYVHFCNRLFNLTGKYPSTLRSDGGGEFTSDLIKLFCQSKGTFQELTSRYTPQHNARAERSNRTLKEGTLAMLVNSLQT